MNRNLLRQNSVKSLIVDTILVSPDSLVAAIREQNMGKIQFILNGKPTSGTYGAGDDVPRSAARGLRHHFGQKRLRAGRRLRLLRGAGQRASRAGLPAQAGADGRPRNRHARRRPEEMRKSLGEAFVHEGGVQCGFCIPGIVVRASSLVRARADGRSRRSREGARPVTSCRCTGYARILDAIQTAGEAWKNGRQAAAQRAAPPLLFRRAVWTYAESARSRNEHARTASARRLRATAASSRRWERSRSSTTCACRACCTGRRC